MNTKPLPVFRLAVLAAGFVLVFLGVSVSQVAAQETSALVERGKYVTHIAGCISCHTPYLEKYQDFSKLTPEELALLGLSGNQTLDMKRAYSGGRPFDLGPGGLLFSRNLTPDKETGLGNWTDEQIEVAMRFGVRRDSSRLHPLMPYRNFARMSKEDVKAVIAFLRSLPPVVNKVPYVAPKDVPPVTAPDKNLLDAAPKATDKAKLGEYLANVVMSCGDCHTPLDPKTGAPVVEKLLAGGQPYEGPWGIVYGGNITPDKDTGIGNWSEEQIIRAVTTGVRIDDRRLVLMPWEDYAALSKDDASALAYYLHNVLPAVKNEVPVPAINKPFLQKVSK